MCLWLSVLCLPSRSSSPAALHFPPQEPQDWKVWGKILLVLTVAGQKKPLFAQIDAISQQFCHGCSFQAFQHCLGGGAVWVSIHFVSRLDAVFVSHSCTVTGKKLCFGLRSLSDWILFTLYMPIWTYFPETPGTVQKGVFWCIAFLVFLRNLISPIFLKSQHNMPVCTFRCWLYFSAGEACRHVLCHHSHDQGQVNALAATWYVHVHGSWTQEKELRQRGQICFVWSWT